MTCSGSNEAEGFSVCSARRRHSKESSVAIALRANGRFTFIPAVGQRNMTVRWSSAGIHIFEKQISEYDLRIFD